MQISKRFIKGISCTIGLLFLLAPLTVQAQTKTKVVVIPLGDDAVKVNPLKNVITVAKANGNFSDPVAAVNSITDASAANPYLVVIGPGVYTITQTLQMKSYVDIVGSGENVTKLTGAISGNTLTQSAIIAGANHSALSSVTVEHAGGSSFSLSLYNDSASPMISDVTVLASGGSSSCGVYNSSSSPTMTNVTATASGGSSSYGVYNSSSSPTMTGITVTVSAGDVSIGVANYSSSSPTMTDIAVTASGGATWSFGVDNKNSSSPTMTNVAATASGSGWVFGVHNTNDSSYSSSPTMTNVTATSSGGAAGGTSYGVYNFSCSAVIRRSTMKGATYSIKTDQIPVTISQSTLLGAVAGGVNNKCVACDNGSGTALGANCQ